MIQKTPVQFLDSLLASLEDHLPTQPGRMVEIKKLLEITIAHHRALLDYLKEVSFESKAEEACFFKQIKPQFDGRIIFYTWLLRVVSLLPQGSRDAQESYYRDLVTTVHKHHQQQADLYLYLQVGMTHLDELYFTRARSSPGHGDFSAYYLLSDSALNAPKSHALASLTACQLMEEYLNQQLWFIKDDSQPDIPTPTLTWTASKAALVELLYALQEFGVFNHSKPEIKKVADYFALIFNIKIGNVYKIYEDNRLRKKNRTPFLDNLRSSLIRRMELDDEHAL